MDLDQSSVDKPNTAIEKRLSASKLKSSLLVGPLDFVRHFFVDQLSDKNAIIASR
jgi:hypothetical protein